jgi:SNF2 family DNA or RNA helicase
MRLTHNCPTCKIEVKTITEEFPLGNLMNYVYQCGHIEIREPFKFEEEIITPKVSEAKIPSWAWALKPTKPYFCIECNETHTVKHAYPYQREGVEFVINNGVHQLIADEMGLGKTIQAALVLRRLTKELTPCLIAVKGATMLQWIEEIREWTFNEITGVIPITNRASFIPGFKCYVMSMDLFSKPDIRERISELGIRSIIMDECQSYKDSSSKRTIGLIKVLEENSIERKIMLSGTPIKNRADEYFTALNLLAPSRFSSYKYFCSQYLKMETDPKTGKPKGYTKLDPVMKPVFERNTRDIIIRRECSEIQRELPPLRINFIMTEIDDPGLKQSYNYQLDLFRNWLQNKAGISATGMLGWLAKLRAITGQAKCSNAVEYISDFMDTVEDQKLAIGIHHTSVRDTLKLVLARKGYDALSLSGADDNFAKGEIAKTFNEDSSKRLLIINSVAGGVGLNLQGCSNFIQLERMWNGADEDQFVKRFHRNGQLRPVHGTYFIAKNTIDEFYHEMIWKKRNNLASVNIGEQSSNEESVDFLREFSEYVINNKV